MILRSERSVAHIVFLQRRDKLLDLVFCLANRENDDPLVLDAREIVAAIEQEQGATPR